MLKPDLSKKLAARLSIMVIVSCLFCLVGIIAPAPAAHATCPSGGCGPDRGIQCGAQRHNPADFTVHSGGGYTGKDMYGNTCDGAFSYVLTPTSAYAVWTSYFYNNYCGTPCSDTALFDVWAYIPNVDAGAYVNYSVTEHDLLGGIHTWDFNDNFYQNAYSGWQNLGAVSVEPNYVLDSITIRSTSSQHLYMAEDAIGFSCVSYCA